MYISLTYFIICFTPNNRWLTWQQSYLTLSNGSLPDQNEYNKSNHELWYCNKIMNVLNQMNNSESKSESELNIQFSLFEIAFSASTMCFCLCVFIRCFQCANMYARTSFFFKYKIQFFRLWLFERPQIFHAMYLNNLWWS